MATFNRGTGDWKEYEKLGTFLSIDFHPPDSQEERLADMMPFYQRMELVTVRSIATLKEAYEQNIEYVIFRHGWSTSGIGKTSARSKVRAAMKSPEATPYIVRKECIQHGSVFVAKIKPNKKG